MDSTDNLMTIEMPSVVQQGEIKNGELINVVTKYVTPESEAVRLLSTEVKLALGEARAARAEIVDLKDQINSSLEEIANMLNELTAGISFLNERLALFNTKAGHKI